MTILNRLRSAESGSRDLDAAIYCHVEECEFVSFVTDFDDDFIKVKRTGFKYVHDEIFPAYTTSIDAALALVERMLPDANCVGFDKTPLRVDAYVSRNNVKSGHWCEDGWHKSSVPLAILCALFAKLAKDTTP